MVRRLKGRIIVTTSTQGRHGTPFGAAYSASKWGIIGLMKSSALELGKYGITVNALVPGLIDMPLTRHEERHAQALEVGAKTPTGDFQKDEEAAREALKAKVGTKSTLVYRSHDFSFGASRRHRREEASVAEDNHPTMESAIIAKFKVTGLKAAVR